MVNVIYFIKDNVNQTSNNRRSVRRSFKGFLMNYIKIGFELLKFIRIQRHDLLPCFLKEIKFIEIIDVTLTFEKNLLTKEKYFGIVTCTQISEFTDCRWANCKDGWCMCYLCKQVSF